MKWKTAEGEVIDIRDMSDVHLANSIAFAQRIPKLRYAVPELIEEQRRREQQRLRNLQAPCPCCGRPMTVGVISNIDVGLQFDRYAFVCTCGASSNIVARLESLPAVVDRLNLIQTAIEEKVNADIVPC